MKIFFKTIGIEKKLARSKELNEPQKSHVGKATGYKKQDSIKQERP